MWHPRDGERLSAADASNVVIDAPDQVNVFLIAGLLGVGGFVAEDGGLDIDLLRATVAARLADPQFNDLARFCQRVQGFSQWVACQPGPGLAHPAGRPSARPRRSCRPGRRSDDSAAPPRPADVGVVDRAGRITGRAGDDPADTSRGCRWGRRRPIGAASVQ